MHQLDRSPDDGDASPIDPNHRGRYIVDPPCRRDTGELPPIPKKVMRHTDEAYQFTARYVLPDIECEHCILQLQHRKFWWCLLSFPLASCGVVFCCCSVLLPGAFRTQVDEYSRA